jgi:8-oxo-dGTP pyrophosphatase MutT (NUDIX family)
MTGIDETKKHLIDSGVWGNDVNWELYLSENLPDEGLCSSVGCVAIVDLTKDQVALTKNQRGIEMPGGHIDPGETLEDALKRETDEEVGFEISTYTPFAYRKVTAFNNPDTRTGRQLNYSYPVSYIPYYYAYTTMPLKAPTGEEVLESMVCSLDEIGELLEKGKMKTAEVTIINHGLDAAKKATQR